MPRVKERPRSGVTVAGRCPDPRFAGVLWGEDIDWTKQEAAPIDEETARALTARLSPSTVQSAINAVNGRGDRIEAWRLQSRANGRIDWNTVPLGTMPDASIARQVGVTTSAARHARERRGIREYRKERDVMDRVKAIDWSRQPLGKMSDAKLAKRLKVRAHDVTKARYRLGIAASGPNAGLRDPRGQPINWDKIPLGKVTDAEAGRMAGCSKANAHDQRVRRGIPPFKPFDWDAQPFGEKTDKEIAAAIGASPHSVYVERKKRGIASVVRPDTYKKVSFNWDRQPLGKVPDRVIAERLGVSSSGVAKARNARGIDPCRAHA